MTAATGKSESGALVMGCKPYEQSSSSEAGDSSDDDDDWDGYDGDSSMPLQSRRQAGSGGRSEDPAVTKQAALQRLQARVNFDFLPQSRAGLSHKAQNDIINSEKKAAKDRNLGLTQDTRATVEQVLDPRTLLVLNKFLKRGLFTNIHGCISTGKEANVYYATGAEGKELAVKVYKTSILVFKDRARYVEGEFRFRNGYCKGNPRKMVAQWAEKEMRNLKRIKATGIMCPEVLEVRQNVLVMDFLGENGDAAPRLKDAAGIDAEGWTDLYVQCVLTMRRLMQECRLVHGDLSEYNMLYFAGDLYVIDVSQSVECDHPQSLDFLKRDCANVNNFFAKYMAGNPIGVKKLFDFVVTKELPAALSEGSVEAAVKKLLAEAAEAEEEDAEEEAVFMQTWIPSHLDQVSDRSFMERDIARKTLGEELLYDRLLVDKAQEDQDAASTEDEAAEKSTAADDAEARGEESNRRPDIQDAEDDSGDDDDGSDDGEQESQKPERDGHKPDGMDKAEWKKLVKAERAEKRKDKCPKALKKKYRKEAAKGR